MMAAVKGKLSAPLICPDVASDHASLLADEDNNSRGTKHFYHHRDLFQRQDKWFPPGSLAPLQTGGGHADVKESEDARGHTQERIPGHHRGKGGPGLGEVPRCQVADCQLHLGGSHQVPDSEGREQEQDGGRGQEGGDEGKGGGGEGETGASPGPLQTATYSEEGRAQQLLP